MREITSKEEKALATKLVEMEDMKPVPLQDDRITAQFNLYYEQQEFSPTQITTSFSTIIPKSEEQVYVRRIKIQQDWMDLDFGWVKKSGAFLVENRKTISSIRLSKEEEKKNAKSVLRIRKKEEKGEGWPVNLGGFFFVFSSEQNVEVRCEEGEATVVVHVIPGE